MGLFVVGEKRESGFLKNHFTHKYVGNAKQPTIARAKPSGEDNMKNKPT